MRKLTFEEITNSRICIEELNSKNRIPIYSVLDNIRSMYNVGSIFRTSDATRIEKLILCGMTAHPPRKEIDKTALGSVDSVPWEYVKDGVEAIKMLKDKGIKIVVVEQTDESCDYRDLNVTYPLALVFGHEVTGVSDEIINLADYAVEIPMYGVKQSLNVAVAYGIASYYYAHKYLQSNKL
ncbi:MAG: RNA methyltransferase [Spirochaetota bacterium]|nr:RNA methyltransferase [Spirochaetota bacterium]